MHKPKPQEWGTLPTRNCAAPLFLACAWLPKEEEELGRLAHPPKRLAEIAEGVGRFTVLSITAPSENEELKFRNVHDEGLEFLEKKYKEYGLKPTDDFELPE